MSGRTFQDWLGVSEDKRRGRHCGRGGKGAWESVERWQGWEVFSKHRGSREHEMLDSNCGTSMEPGSVIENHGWNITALNLTLD